MSVKLTTKMLPEETNAAFDDFSRIFILFLFAAARS